MSLTATWISAVWTAVGAVAAGALRPISMAHLAKPTTLDRAPRPPPYAGIVAGQVPVTATLFGLLAWRFGPHLELLAYSYLAAVAVPLSVIDVLEMRLPRRLVLPLYPACLALFGLTAAANDDGAQFVRAMAGMAVLLTSYFVTAVLSHGGLGAGDIRAAGPIGLALAWISWPTVLEGTLLSLLFFTAMTFLSRDATRPFHRRDLPFGPAMFAGTFFAILT